jgi:hypothetical protein
MTTSTIATAGATVLIVTFTKAIVVDVLGNVLTDKLQHWATKYWHRKVLFLHGAGHVQKDTLHQPRNPLNCRDGDCPSLGTARLAVPPRSQRQTVER